MVFTIVMRGLTRVSIFLGKRVGWVERSDTHRLQAMMLMGFAKAQPTYGLDALARDRAAIIRLAKSGGLGIVLRAEPAIGAGQRRIAAANLQVINPDIAGDPRAKGILALDAATRRHRGFVGKYYLAYLA